MTLVTVTTTAIVAPKFRNLDLEKEVDALLAD